MRKAALTGLLVFLIISLFLVGTFFIETGRCKLLEHEYPEYHWQVNLFKCYALVNGKWLDADRFQMVGKSP